MNRIVQLYRHEFGMVDGEKNSSDKWDTHLYTPSSIISLEEHTVISNLIDSRVEMLYQSKAIVDPKRLVQIMTKPVRAIWVSNDMIHQDTIFSSPKERLDKVSFSIIACCNPSLYLSNTKNHIQWMQHHVHSSDEEIGYYYTPGAADDDATWARRLTHELFWKHKDQILNPSLSEDATDTLIDSLVEQHQIQHDNGQIVEDNSSNDQTMDQIGSMNLWIGSRRAGRPPECWNNFEAILNVTENEYPNMQQSIAEQTQQTCYYLQLPVAEGKRDKTELERWMPIGLVFIIQHLQRGRRVLVHCAQGKDRSVAMVLALVAIACPLTYPLKLHDKFQGWNVASIVPDTSKSNEKGKLCYLQSGLLKYLTDALLRENGSDIFLQWIHNNQDIPMDKTLATKESLRITLHLVGQDREVAHPTRSSMQKLNRFFMSGSRYRS